MSEDVNKFFISCPVGLEEALGIQFVTCFPELKVIKKEKGGILVEAPSHYWKEFNRQLRAATRVLIQINDFKVKDFPKLFKKILNINWRDFLFSQNFEISASSKASRLIHSDRIEKTVQDAIEKYFVQYPPKKKDMEIGNSHPPIKILVRIIDDHATVSIDTSGTPLHKRDYQKETHRAPIRGTIASGLLTLMTREFPNNSGIHLMDPMCGSGTFILEGLFFKCPTRQEFCESLKLEHKTISHLSNSPFIKFTGVEKNKDVYSRLQTNLGDYLNRSVELQNMDFHNHEINKNGDLFIITNPPYQKRIKAEPNNEKYYSKLLRDLERLFTPKGVGIIVPNEFEIKLNKSASLREKKRYFIENGGIKVTFYIFENYKE